MTCFGVLRHELLEFRLCSLVILVSQAGLQVGCCKLGPKVGRAHIDDLDRFEPGSRRFNPEKARGIAGLHAAPKLLLSGQNVGKAHRRAA